MPPPARRTSSPLCLNSGLPTRYGNTFATPEDYREYQARVSAEVAELVAAGFVQNPSTPNLFTKDGLSVTLESYRRDRDGTLAEHAGLVAQRQEAGAASN